MIIRDNVHGDIEIPKKFEQIVNAKEFQRLRRIKQLATADQIFPGATHSRFAHSIGVYYVMTRVLAHFEKILRSIGQETCIDEEEKDIILAAALLHDIGHGPFSHAFEDSGIISKNSHEEWTEKIICDHNTDVCRVLQSWGSDVPERVRNYINYRRQAKKVSLESDEENNSLDFKFIFTSLVSSQLDADRMDYLLRDSLNCGVNFGRCDLDNLIEGMTVGVDGEGRFRVCVRKNYLANAEEYFFARYQMYRNIYYHPYKVLTETLLKNILFTACQYYLHGQLDAGQIPQILRSIFDKAEISLEDYLQLDDTVVMGAIHTWSHLESDKVSDLSKLCQCFLYRCGYRQILLTDVDSFLCKASELLREECSDVKVCSVIINLVFVKCINKAKMYDKASEKPVYILKDGGIINKIEDISGLMGERRREMTLYYNQEFCQKYLRHSDKMEKLLDDYNIEKSVEIEKKYIFEDNIYQTAIDILKERGYAIEERSEEEQTDNYYDTDKKLFYDNNYTLRIRSRGDRYWITFKFPSNSVSSGENGQLERNEIEREIESSNLQDNQEIICEYFRGFLTDNCASVGDLRREIDIKNTRKKIIATKYFNNEYISEEKYEIAFDNVEYINLKNSNTYHEKQMEIELKSLPETRINMKALTDVLEKKISTLMCTSDSKYHRAVKLTNDTPSE